MIIFLKALVVKKIHVKGVVKKIHLKGPFAAYLQDIRFEFLKSCDLATLPNGHSVVATYLDSVFR